MADEFGAFKQKMHGALDEAFEQPCDGVGRV